MHHGTAHDRQNQNTYLTTASITHRHAGEETQHPNRGGVLTVLVMLLQMC